MPKTVFVFISVPQRMVCSAVQPNCSAGLLSCHVTAHFLRVRMSSGKFNEISNLTYCYILLFFYRALVRILRVYLLAVFPLQGVLYASVRCGCPCEELNKAWSEISLHCPLLLVSTVVPSVPHTTTELSDSSSLTFESYTFGFSQYAYCMRGQ